MENTRSENFGIYLTAGIASLLAMATNIVDVALGMGAGEVVASGSRSAIEWFELFDADAFRGLYELGILNIVYMTLMAPMYLALRTAHRDRGGTTASLAAMAFMLGMSAYIANNAAIPMAALAEKYRAAGTDAARALFAAAGEAALARGEDFTPGSFVGLFIGGTGSVLASAAMLRGGIFGKANAWIGIVGFSFLQMFTVLATFVPAAYLLTFYVFGMGGGLLALSWFCMTALRFFALARSVRSA